MQMQIDLSNIDRSYLMETQLNMVLVVLPCHRENNAEHATVFGSDSTAWPSVSCSFFLSFKPERQRHIVT